MKKYLILVIAALFIGAAPGFAGDGATGGLKVQLRDADGRIVQTATTNDAGEFTFQKIEMGEYTVFVEQGQIDNAMKKAKKAAKKAKAAARITANDNDDSDGDGVAISFSMNFEESPDYEVVTAREASSGQASGKRTHKPVTFVKEWGASSPQLKVKKGGTTIKASWDLATNKGG